MVGMRCTGDNGWKCSGLVSQHAVTKLQGKVMPPKLEPFYRGTDSHQDYSQAGRARTR
jgi:hypothetical protein